MALIDFTEHGLYCPAGGFYIDPWKPVERAIITHAHSDHARVGSQNYLCHTKTKPLLQLRLGYNPYQAVEWNEPLYINGVKVSLHPAGHIIGSSQVRLEYKDEVWVFSGDYKLEDDGISGAFELPIYKWKKQALIYNDIQQWIVQNQQAGKASVILAYSLGKAQRVLQAASGVTDNIFVHGAVWNAQQALLSGGENLPVVKRVTADMAKSEYKNAVIIAPPSTEGSSWLKRFAPFSLAVCSGWMQVRGNARRRNADRGFVLSDHADWEGLLTAVSATGAEKVFVTHGFQSAFSKYLNENGIMAAEVKTGYGDEEEMEKAIEEV
jgi:putative mRNA 3-end processing factor